ncbi:unnamed protein product, partial [Meganyctiphanes norvegica]
WPQMDLSCKICFESYTGSELSRPRSLFCGHTLCGECATKLLVNGELRCPLCQQNHKYQSLNKIIINHELEDVIEMLASKSTESGPKLHYGKCEQHGAYKVHHCLTHEVFICSDCALAYHLENYCCRVPIEAFLNNRKDELCKKIETRMSSLQEIDGQVKLHDPLSKMTEDQIKTQINKLQSDLKTHQQQMNFFQNSTSEYTELFNECENRLRQAQNITTFRELEKETKLVKSSDNKTQEWTKLVKDKLTQHLGEILTSGTLERLVASRDVCAIHTHNKQQKFGRIFARDGYLILQDFRNFKPPSCTAVINLRDVIGHLSSPRHIYLSLSNWDNPLGMIIIKVNEKAPRRAQQLIDLCVGQTGAKYSGSTGISVCRKGKTGEHISFTYYLNSNGRYSYAKLVSDIEVTEPVLHNQGTCIFNQRGEQAGFSIFTKRDHLDTWDGPVLGEVISGFPVLEKVIEINLIPKGWCKKSHVTISESGLIIAAICHK